MSERHLKLIHLPVCSPALKVNSWQWIRVSQQWECLWRDELSHLGSTLWRENLIFETAGSSVLDPQVSEVTSVSSLLLPTAMSSWELGGEVCALEMLLPSHVMPPTCGTAGSDGAARLGRAGQQEVLSCFGITVLCVMP